MTNLHVVGDREFHALTLDPLRHVADQQVHDQLDLRPGQRVEHDHLVHAVQELGPERLLQLIEDEDRKSVV